MSSHWDLLYKAAQSTVISIKLFYDTEPNPGANDCVHSSSYRRGKRQQRNKKLECWLGGKVRVLQLLQDRARLMLCVSKGPSTARVSSGVTSAWVALVPSSKNKGSREHLVWARKPESKEKRAIYGIAPKCCPSCSALSIHIPGNRAQPFASCPGGLP